MQKLDISNKVEIRPVTIDDIATVRYIHTSAFNIFASAQHSEDEVRAQMDMIQSKTYVDAILSNNLCCAWIGNEMVGTSGWCPADDTGGSARITMVAIRPMFHTIGIGRLLVKNAEARAKHAGFSDFSVRSSINTINFFKHLGYKISSHGVMPTRMKIDLPVAFMRKHKEMPPSIHHVYSRKVAETAVCPAM